MFSSLVLSSLLFVSFSQAAPKCSVTEEDMLLAGKKLFLIGDRELVYPQNANQEMDTHCKKMLKNTDTVRAFARCQQPIQKTLIGMFGSGFRKEIKKSCANKSWREDLASSMQCLQKSGKMESIHRCMDVTAASANFIFDTLPVKDQLISTCCLVLLTTDCIKENIGKECGPNAGELHANMFVNNLGEIFNFICGSMNTKAQCKKTFPKPMKEIEKIYNSTKNLPQENVIGPLLKIAMAQTS